MLCFIIITLIITSRLITSSENYDRERTVYIWSEGRKKFLSYPPDPRSEEKIVLAPGNRKKLRSFVIEETETEGTLKFYLTDERDKRITDRVMDVSGATGNLIAFAPHGGGNQKFYLKGVNVNLYRLESENFCVEADGSDDNVLKGRGSNCRKDGGPEMNQFFRLFGSKEAALDYEDEALASRYPLPLNFIMFGPSRADEGRPRGGRNGPPKRKRARYDDDSRDFEYRPKPRINYESRPRSNDICCHKRDDDSGYESDDRGYRDRRRSGYNGRSYLNSTDDDQNFGFLDQFNSMLTGKSPKPVNSLSEINKDSTEDDKDLRKDYNKCESEKNEITILKTNSNNLRTDDHVLNSLSGKAENRLCDTKDTVDEKNKDRNKPLSELKNEKKTDLKSKDKVDCTEYKNIKDTTDPICSDNEIKLKLKQISELSPIPLNW